jgi:hypothetical protein
MSLKFINTNIPPPTYSVQKGHTMSNAQYAFAVFSTYLLFPLFYLAVSTGNITPIIKIWKFIQSGFLDTLHQMKMYWTDVVYATLRLFGQYRFSTYTVVKNGREIFVSSSICFNIESDVSSVYYVDRAKYSVCKWIDRECRHYSIKHGEEPELTETHNDIYDFIIHKVDNQPYARIHRGDFSGRTHTLIDPHYRPFIKENQIAKTAEITICIPNNASDSGGELEPAAAKPETFLISLKRPYNFFLEKNEILDKKFLQWKLYNEYGRKDLADYIGTPFSKYTLNLPYDDGMNPYFTKEMPKILGTMATATTTPLPIYSLNDSHSVLIGNRYLVKVDSVLRCPVFGPNDSQVYDIDNILATFYDCSDTDGEDSSSEDSEDSENSEDSQSDGESREGGDIEGESREEEGSQENVLVNVEETEFEIIEGAK